MRKEPGSSDLIIHDQTDYGTWGRNLSENKLRSFNWQAECVCFARMKAEGKGWEHIARVFGLKSQDDVNRRIALGNLPNIDRAVGVSFEDARDYLLPLRVEVSRNPDNGNERVYDYSEVTACIYKLVSGELTRESLPAYVTERRLAIQEMQQERKFKEVAAKELAVMRDKLSAKDKEAKAANDKIQSETKRLQEQATKQAASLKAEYEEKVKKATAEMKRIILRSSTVRRFGDV